MIIATIIGVRPQFVKAAVLSPVIRKEHKEILIHTGQHYDDNMSAVFFKQLGLQEPDYILDGKGNAGTEENRVERMTGDLVSVLQKEPVDAVLLYGDTDSTLAGALAADRLKIPAIHVEAGERNGLVNNLEEAIRKRADQLSSLLLCCSGQAIVNLISEGLGDRVHFIGNLMEISFLNNINKPWKPHLVKLNQPEKEVFSIPSKFYLLTCHRQENANEKNLTEILLAMEQAKFPVLFPVHPRNQELVLKIYNECKLKNLILTEPASYFDSIHLIKNAVTVVTDSGGVLQEAHFAQTPYVFVLDIACPPETTRFDLKRLAKPERCDILRKLEQPQVFSIGTDLQQILSNTCEEVKLVNDKAAKFEENVLEILRAFERKL